MKNKTEEKKAFLNLLFLIVVILLILISNHIISINFVVGNSMYPYVSNNGIVLTQKYNFSLNRYDVVLADVKSADNKFSQTAIKRVIGIPYDNIKIVDGYIYINDKKIDEYNYYISDSGVLHDEITLGEDEYFLLGDNREISYDSRFYGAVKCENVKGKIVKVITKGLNENVDDYIGRK